MLYKHLTNIYKPNEPIFLSDIILPDITNNYLRQMFKLLCDSEKLKRFDTGIYYLPDTNLSSVLTNTDTPETSDLSVQKVAEYKYISRRNVVNGYYSGHSFAKTLGLDTYSTNTLEITSNFAGGKYREITLKETPIILRRPKFPVTNENHFVLQFLDFLKDIDLYADYKSEYCRWVIWNYMKSKNITKELIDEYITEYPDKIYKFIYEMRLYETFGAKFSIDTTVETPSNKKRRKELSVELL